LDSGTRGVDRDAEQPDQHFLLLNHDRDRRRQHVGAESADHNVDVVDVRQLLIEAGDRRQVA